MSRISRGATLNCSNGLSCESQGDSYALCASHRATLQGWVHTPTWDAASDAGTNKAGSVDCVTCLGFTCTCTAHCHDVLHARLCADASPVRDAVGVAAGDVARAGGGYRARRDPGGGANADAAGGGGILLLRTLPPAVAAAAAAAAGDSVGTTRLGSRYSPPGATRGADVARATDVTVTMLKGL